MTALATKTAADPDAVSPALVAASKRRAGALLGEFNEEDHPRDEHGRFGEGSGDTKSTDTKPESKPEGKTGQAGREHLFSALNAYKSSEARAQLKSESAARVGKEMDRRLDAATLERPASEMNFNRNDLMGIMGEVDLRGSDEDITVGDLGRAIDASLAMQAANDTERSYAEGNLEDAMYEARQDGRYLTAAEMTEAVNEGLDRDGSAGAGFAALYTNKWAETSNDSDYQALALQFRAYSMFQTEPVSYVEGVNRGNVATIAAAQAPVLDAYLASSYAETQAYFKDQGISSMTLMRGVGNTPSSWKDGDTVSLTSNPLTSWSADPGTASGFAIDQWANYGSGALLEAEVPVENIVATPFTGAGCATEYETVVGGMSGGLATVFEVITEEPV